MTKRGCYSICQFCICSEPGKKCSCCDHDDCDRCHDSRMVEIIDLILGD